ncbi:MAG: hypothetical protein P8107_06990 [Spirochaetia bacterium]|jgi:hypothetical protein
MAGKTKYLEPKHYADQEYAAWEAIYDHIKESPAKMKKEIIRMLMKKLIIFRKE